MTNVFSLPARESAGGCAQRVRPRDYLDRDSVRAVRSWLRLPGVEDRELSNAVARVCLNPIQDRLPQWGAIDRDGDLILGRGVDARRRARVELVPQHLFTLNWADSGPGFSWREAYHAIFLPGFGRWVVTMSVDSTDVWGVTDLAIGAFGVGSDVVRSSGRIIVRYWREQQCFDETEGGWAYLLDTGLVDSSVAWRWRRRVWRSVPASSR